MVGITETVLRDGHQSLIATRMRTKHMLPIAEQLDSIGYRSLEVWGGATFDVCLRFLREDPWERLREIKRRVTRTPLQMLLRGQNLVGYRHYADDLVDAFVREAATQGIDIFRVFDALNDPRNMEVALRAVKRYGGRAQGTICYTQSPVHTLASFIDLGRTLAEMGADEICVKDMGGFMPPTDGGQLVRALVKEVGLPVVVHTHSSSGMATLTCLAAAEAGATAIDSAISTFAGGASQPPTETMVGAMRGTPLDPRPRPRGPGRDRRVLPRRARALPAAARTAILQTDPIVLDPPGPGRDALQPALAAPGTGRARSPHRGDAGDPRVRADLGYPPLVTPTSQIVGIQAVYNVLLGKRYAQITQEVRDYVKGLYGRPPGPLDPVLQGLVLANEAPLTGRPADLLAPELARAITEVRALVPVGRHRGGPLLCSLPSGLQELPENGGPGAPLRSLDVGRPRGRGRAPFAGTGRPGARSHGPSRTGPRGLRLGP